MTAAYLDTPVLVWLYAGNLDRIARTAASVLETHELLVSPIVLLEIQYLQEKGVVMVSPDAIFAELAQTIGLALCSIPFAAVTRSAFSLNWTRDPFDRLIVAQAMVHERRLLTKDRIIAQHYAHTVW